MPIESPALDDLDYATVEAMLRNRIPLVAPEWTDHNDSDPGIALIQLFAFLSEQIGYRLNRVPEKTYVEFLKLVGVRQRPATPASTIMAFTLAKPARATQVLIPAGARITAKGGDGEPPVFETDAPLDVLPAQMAALISTQHGLTQINGSGETGPTVAGADPKAYVDARFSLIWDGKTPKQKDIPTQPLPLFTLPSEAAHRTLWIGLAFNRSLAAGFLGARATLTLQLDDDEQPESDTSVECGGVPLSIVNAFDPAESNLQRVEYTFYQPPGFGMASGSWAPLPALGDETDGWTRSGAIRFDVPRIMGPIPDAEWQDVEAGLPHPLVGALKTPVDGTPNLVPISGWIGVTFVTPPRARLRALNFNMTGASNALTIRGEQLGRGSGAPGQVMQLGKPNILAGSLDLVSLDYNRPDEVLEWRAVDDFDAAGPFDSVYVLDAEAGQILFGDGVHGAPPQPMERLVARCYRHGGGVAGEVATGAVSQPSALPAAIDAAFNVTPARGGRDAETLDEAKVHAPRAFQMRGRAVTADDFVEQALAAPGVRIARAQVIPLRRPYPEGHQSGGMDAPGIDFGAPPIAGAVSVLAVPDRAGPYPMPTRGELTAVASHLDRVRLLTTEVHVTTPQYVRLFNFETIVRAAAGYTRTALREAISSYLETRFHALSGGPDGTGYPFGGGLHHADLVAATLSVPGVKRVEQLACWYDGQTPAGSEPTLTWRIERQVARRLTNCVETEADDDHIVLAGDELVFIDPSTFNVQVVGAP